jgi:hypothetical protein
LDRLYRAVCDLHRAALLWKPKHPALSEPEVDEEMMTMGITAPRQSKDTLSTRLVLGRAIRHLVAREGCSRRKARRRIHQQARALKASLRDVAEAILTDETAEYRYDVPV